MSEPGKKTIVKEAVETPKIKLEEEPSGSIPATTKQQVEDYLRRKAEVTQDDHQAFQDYLNDKARSVPAPVEPPAKPESKFNRRNLLKVVAGTAVAGEAVAVGYSWVTASSDPAAQRADSRYAGAQREHITSRDDRLRNRTSADVVSANGLRCCRPSSAAAPMRSISTAIVFWRRSGTGPTAITTRSPTICARSRALIPITRSSSSTAPRAARTA